MRRVIVPSAELAELCGELTADGRAVSFEAHGASMSPWIRDGDVLVVEPVAPETVRRGDVLLYRAASGALTAHRVVGASARGPEAAFRMRPDAAPRDEEVVATRQILGRVVALSRGSETRRLDRGSWRTFGAILATLPGPPHAWRFLDHLPSRALARAMRPVQAHPTYRQLGRTLAAGRIACSVATPGDRLAIDGFYRTASYGRTALTDNESPELIKWVESPGFALSARLAGVMAGTAICPCHGGEAPLFPGWWLFGLLVRPSMRGVGVGEQLVLAALWAVAARGGRELRLVVARKNHAAIRLYEKLGFSRASLPTLDRALEDEVRRGLPARMVMARALPDFV